MPLPDPRLEDQPDHHRDSRPGHAGEAIGQGEVQSTDQSTSQSTSQSTGQSIHQTLAVRIAQRNLLRAERAARLARLRPAEAVRPIGAGRAPESQLESQLESQPETRPEAAEDAGAALEDFLRALTGGMARTAAPLAAPGPAPEAEAGAILHFQRPGATEPAARPIAAPEPVAAPESVFTPEPACDLDRLPGAGPGLIWALRRAGLRRLDDLAPLEGDELTARLGPLGRLVPASAWIAKARAARAKIEIEAGLEPPRRDPGSTLRIW